ncbi:MAG: Unknown protein [uncultured Sulfurovum sp.]|uniref:Bacterial surface antigen (D15) domain-containing protein n=1 Tax=uncultured Sulfurovum sp. TaxID=269237 RepID=A0A6S6UIT0_9BACT|nr:MAG: Unknown protein [uncultured Sulfurovum sp.]
MVECFLDMEEVVGSSPIVITIFLLLYNLSTVILQHYVIISVMKKNIIFLWLFTIYVQAQTLTSIEFRGDIDLLTGDFDRTTLLKICHIEYPAIYKFWKRNPTFESSQVPNFVKNLEAYTYSKGYYKSTISSQIEAETIYIDIKKNEPILINSIHLEDAFHNLSLLTVGEQFTTSNFTETKNNIRNYLSENAYPKHHLKAKAFVDIDAYQVDVNFSIEKGKKYYFGSTELNNSSQIDNVLIQEQIVYEEGELFNVLKLEESYDNIYRLGVFEKIKMEPDFNTSLSMLDIDLLVKEGKTKEFASNLGYDTEDGARGGVAYIDHNFFGNLRRFETQAQVSERGYEAKTSYFDPRLENVWLGDFSFLNELGYSQWDYDAYVENLFVERVTLGKKFLELEHFFGFQLEHSEIESGIPIFLSGNYLINSLFYRVLIDKRDSIMDAKNGYYTSLYLEKAMKQLGSEIDYFKILAEARYIKSFDAVVLATKIKVGSISQETPPFKHFFLGGAMSNRGYEYRDLGEHSGEYPLGGLSMIDASFESRYYLSQNFAIVGFVDSSKLSQNVNDFSGAWYSSIGFGVRYLSVIGPLRLDLGYPFRGNKPALHLGIGQVF